MDEQAKAHIAAAIEAAEASGEPIDGVAIGRRAAAKAIEVYMAAGAPQSAVDASHDELASGSENP